MIELAVFSVLAVVLILGQEIGRRKQRRRDREAVTRSLHSIDREMMQSFREHESQREREIHG